MKNLVHELEKKNAELQEKLDAALAQLKEGNIYMNSDPFIDEEIRKCHDVFLCPNEGKYKKLSELLVDPQSKLTMVVKVEGRQVRNAFKKLENDLKIFVPRVLQESRKIAKIFKRMTTVAKYIILGIIEDIYRLHRHGLSLNGKFTIDNFYWTHLKKVKFDPTLKLVVCKRGRDEMNKDFHQIYHLILKMLSYHDDAESIPDDLKSLLDLLNSDDPVKYQEIIRYNMSLLSEIGKKSHFIILYDRLLQLILEETKKAELQRQKDKDRLQQQIPEHDKAKGAEEEKKSEKVLKFISNHFINPQGEPWSSMAQDNFYIGLVYEYRCKKKGCRVLVNVLDLLAVWRNALTHVLDNSIRDGEPLFKDEDLVNMLESTIPGVFNELQRAMAEVGLLELPHLMRAMRM